MFSKSCEYGIKAVIYISEKSQNGSRVSLKEIAKAIDSPIAFTAKIIQSLARADIINSIKGAGGGYEIPLDREITLKAIVKAIDGDKIYVGCGLGLKACNAQKPCPLHFEFKNIRDELSQMLENTTVNSLAQELICGNVYLTRV